MPPVPTGLSAATTSLQNNTYKRTYGSGFSPEEKYNGYKKSNQGITFFKYPPDTPKHTMVLVAREYSIAGDSDTSSFGGAVGAQTGNIGIAKQGFVLPVPTSALVDNVQMTYDDNYSFLSSLLQIAGVKVNQAAAQVVSAVTGFNINKFKSVLFEAPMLKRHHFIWKLAPKTKEESILIRSIVNQLKVCMSPEVKINAILEFPYVFDVYFYPNFSEMYGFKPCVIETLQVDYTGGQAHPSFYTEGYPESIELNMVLLEIEFWDRADYTRWDGNIDDPTNTVRPVELSQARPQQPGNRVTENPPVNNNGPGQPSP